MSESTVTLQIHPKITLVIDESEARMLAKISEWKISDVYDGIVKTVSPRELEKHKPAFITFMEGNRSSLAIVLNKIDKAREASL